MASLTAEQLEKIARNRELALLKKRKAQENSRTDNKCDTSNMNQTLHKITQSGYNRVEKHFPNPPNTELTTVKINKICAAMRLISDSQFTVDMPFHMPSVAVFRETPGKLYDPKSKRWTFPLSSYYILLKELQKLAVISEIPKPIVNALLESNEENENDLSKIDKVLLDTLLPFQEEGIRFGVSKKGRCLIADDMGLGKTVQALGIAHYYRENWPLLILCPSSMRFPWEEAIQVFLPSVNPFYVTVVTSGKDLINEAQVVICSYDLLKICISEISKVKFGAIIMDESHCLKSMKATRTKVALQVAKKCKNVILLSGTPALSRPVELYSQIIAIYPLFLNYHDFGIRYCNGRRDNFGWNFSGSSNTEELEIFLKKKIMIRRLKSEVLTQLPSKIRKVVTLDPGIVMKQMQKLAHDFKIQKGNEIKKTIMLLYSLTASIKTKVVCDYIERKLESNGKMLVFAHHTTVMDALVEMIISKKIDFIKIDGSTSSEMRKTLCDKFQNKEDCRVALLSLRAANAGITLTAAQLVIFAELYWNPGDLTQAEDRAHRIGQKESVVIEYLVAKGTADEYMWKLIQSKLKFLNKVGLSKDNFKDMDGKHCKNGKQLTITSLFQSESMRNTLAESTLKNNDTFGFCDDMENDDLFENIEFGEIDNPNNI